MIPTWPPINYLAERGSFQLALTDGRNKSSSDMDSGDVRFRRRFTRSTSPVAFAVRFSKFELAIFKYFYSKILLDGSKWFYMPIYDGQDYNVNLVRFSSGDAPSFAELGFNDHSVGLSLAIRELTQIDDDVYTYFTRLGDAGNRLSDVVTEYVNEIYPEIMGDV